MRFSLFATNPFRRCSVCQDQKNKTGLRFHPPRRRKVCLGFHLSASDKEADDRRRSPKVQAFLCKPAKELLSSLAEILLIPKSKFRRSQKRRSGCVRFLPCSKAFFRCKTRLGIFNPRTKFLTEKRKCEKER